MEIDEILNKIESIVNDKTLNFSDNKSEKQTNNNSAKEMFYLILRFILSVIKAPFTLIAKYLKNEIVHAVKKDAKLYTLIIGMMGMLFIFFTVLWLFISVAVGVYYFENGNSIFVSALYSIAFQLTISIIVGIAAFILSTRIKSLNMLKQL